MSEPTKLYAVSSGECSEYRVIAIYRDRETAERVAAERIAEKKAYYKEKGFVWHTWYEEHEAFVEEFDFYDHYVPIPIEDDA